MKNRIQNWFKSTIYLFNLVNFYTKKAEFVDKSFWGSKNKSVKVYLFIYCLFLATGYDNYENGILHGSS